MILKNSVILAFFSVISLLLGIFRDRLLAQIVGVGPFLDVYYAAFRIPDWTLAIMLSFASAATVIPFLTPAIHSNDDKEVQKRFNSLFIFFGGSMIVLGLLVVALLPFVARFIVPGFTVDQVTLFVQATSILMIQPLLLGLSTLISSLAQVRHQFLVYSIAPLAYTALIILSVVNYPQYGFMGLIMGVVIGAGFHISIQSYTLYKQGLKINLRHFDLPLVKEHIRFAMPRSGSYITSRTRDIIFSSVATTFGPGALSVYVFAQRVIDAYMQVIVQSISTASLPRLALHHAEGDVFNYDRLVKKSITAILFFSLGMVATLVVFKYQLLSILYGPTAPLSAIGSLLTFLAVGLPVLAINYYFTSAFNASRNNVALFVSNLIATIIAIGALFYLRSSGYGINSLGIASVIMSISYFLILMGFYSRKRARS